MIAYFDCYSGVAGDMVLGALLDAGLPFSHLRKELKKLSLQGYSIERSVERRNSIGGTNLKVISKEAKTCNHRSYSDIKNMISSSKLSKAVKMLALKIFETMARAESRVHRTNINRIHFHEVGSIDSIVDIVGAAIGLDYFKFDEIHSSPLPMTRGFIRCQHGRLPVPAPATLQILKGVPIAPSPVRAEIVTPTGASILKTVVKNFGGCPLTKINKIGYGLGDNHFREIPNALRLMIGEGERLIVIESNIDDMNPQIYDHVIGRLMASGAIDAVVRPIFMKKRRPAAQIQVICHEGLKKKLSNIILKETTTFGVRSYSIERQILDRTVEPIRTKFGAIRMKVGFLDGEKLRSVPEYEDCVKAARRHHVPLKRVLAELAPQ